ncbi:hypothetical protein MVEN_00104500 [Mycena venus]|uniref:Uncharacterized protein n=1 Tax=Mycena venus TaxID=2733690 RepID=A0A8H7DGN0_9AGAR|nr:hypothetical protein MVEN_00104500 [Mycena venus]
MTPVVVAGLGYFTIIDAVVHSNLPELLRFVDLTRFFQLSIVLSLLTTLVLMALTVGRIWSLAWAARRVMGQKVAGEYRTVCAMILESGALYFIGGLGFVTLMVKTGSGTLTEIALKSLATLPGTVLGQLAGIAPTIIAVRVGLGYSIESVDTFVAPRPRTRVVSQVPAATPHSADVVSSDHAYCDE